MIQNTSCAERLSEVICKIPARASSYYRWNSGSAASGSGLRRCASACSVVYPRSTRRPTPVSRPSCKMVKPRLGQEIFRVLLRISSRHTGSRRTIPKPRTDFSSAICKQVSFLTRSKRAAMRLADGRKTLNCITGWGWRISSHGRTLWRSSICRKRRHLTLRMPIFISIWRLFSLSRTTIHLQLTNWRKLSD
jgi:hypothetical protein